VTGDELRASGRASSRLRAVDTDNHGYLAVRFALRQRHPDEFAACWKIELAEFALHRPDGLVSRTVSNRSWVMLTTSR
jgi:hypothetical protein